MRIPAGFFSVSRIQAALLSACFLLLCLSSCSTLTQPKAAALEACFTQPFVCGFRAENRATGIWQNGTFSRAEDGDYLTVTGEYGNTVFRVSAQGAVLLAGSDSGDAVQIPLSLPQNSGILTVHRLFSRIPDDSDTVRRTGDTWTVTKADGTEIAFSDGGIPVSVTCGAYSVMIHSFQTEAS